MADTEFWKAEDDVLEIVSDLIEKYHCHLEGVVLDVWFRDKAKKKGGKVVLGTASVKSGLDAQMIWGEEQGFIIELAADGWKTLDPDQKRALIDHELCHCKIVEDIDKGTVSYKTCGHDIEEFGEIVARHGLWQPDLCQFAKKMPRQLPLEDVS